MVIRNRHYRKVRATNAADTSFPSRVATVTEPTGGGVIDRPNVGGGHGVQFVFYGTGDADDVFDVRVLGWRKVGGSPTGLWVPVIIAGLTCTLGTATGVAGAEVVATELFADTVTITSGGEPTVTADTTRGGTFRLFSPANNLIAWVAVPLYGFAKLELTFDMTTGDPTGANALYSFLDSDF